MKAALHLAMDAFARVCCDSGCAQYTNEHSKLPLIRTTITRSHSTTFPTRDHARLDIVNWVEMFYKTSRLHSADDYKVPNQLERELKAA